MTDIAPPPDDIAGLIEQAETQARVRWGGIAHEHENCLEWKTAAALRSQALEVERLKAIVAQIQPPNDIGDNCMIELAMKCAELEQRIRELEGIVAGLDERSTIYERRAHELEANRDDYWEGWKEAMAERDAIRAKTIEECLEKLPEDTPAYVSASIRALAKNAP